MPGCTDTTACNYDALATIDDSSCIIGIAGCMDTTMFNYDPTAVCDDGSCVPFISGCLDANACNYDATANTNDSSCTYGAPAPISEDFDSYTVSTIAPAVIGTWTNNGWIVDNLGTGSFNTGPSDDITGGGKLLIL